MLGEWKEEKLVCRHCKADVIFRVAFKKAQFLNGKNWTDIAKYAEIVLCPTCGTSVYISSIKEKAEL